MKQSLVFTIFLICTSLPALMAQSILEMYRGNKDSLLRDAQFLLQQPEPTFKTNASVAASALGTAEKNFKSRSSYFRARDGVVLFAYYFPRADARYSIVLLHGVGSNAAEMKQAASLLQQVVQAEVYALDLRGHGRSQGRPGDITYTQQYADDVADVVQKIRKKKPSTQLILAGHSMGGGVLLNYNLRPNAPVVDAYVLLAPLIGHDSPAIIMEQAKEGKIDAEPAMKLHFARIIGLKMLNELGNYEQDHLPVIFFNAPAGSPLKTYTYRANQSMAPESHARGLQAVKIPMLVLAAEKDEVFSAPILTQTVETHSKAKTLVIPAATHDGILQHPKTFETIQAWLASWAK